MTFRSTFRTTLGKSYVNPEARRSSREFVQRGASVYVERLPDVYQEAHLETGLHRVSYQVTPTPVVLRNDGPNLGVQRVVDLLIELSDMEADWDGDDALRLDPKAVSRVNAILFRLDSKLPKHVENALHVSPLPSGGLLLTARFTTERFELIVERTGQMVLLGITIRNGEDVEWSEPQVVGVEEAVRRICRSCELSHWA